MPVLNCVEFIEWDEILTLPCGSVIFFDIECYSNFFYAAFKLANSKKFIAFERSPDFDFDPGKLRFILWKFCIVGFNSRNYDIPMLELAMQGKSCAELKEASDYIIRGDLENKKVTPYVFEKKYNLKIPNYNHIDLINVAPLEGSLKLYAGRLHCDTMQDLPLPPDHFLTKNDAEIIRPYCCNDLNNTELLYNELAPGLKLRTEMSKEYGIDLRSKSDAQIAESVINSELQKVLGSCPKKPTIKKESVLKFRAPDYMQFMGGECNRVLNTIAGAEFFIDGLGSPIMPDCLKNLTITLGTSTYTFGMGGIHSTETSVAHYSNEDIILADNDVESFYPRSILNQRLFPDHLGEAFLTVYEKIVNTRIHAKKQASLAKKAGDSNASSKWKQIADSLKITINGSFGKLGNKYSTLYAPQLLLQVTITGQLVLLMLIEALEKIGIDVVSGNTDGIILKYHRSRHNDVRELITMWENHTGYKTEETRYKATFNRDVNNYFAIKSEGGRKDAVFLDERLGVKTKGIYCERGSALNSVLSKNPETLICSDAVLELIVNGKSIEQTIRECKDIRRFVSVRNVRGGAEKNGQYLGKVVRWYYPVKERGFISYAKSGNKVAKTDGARPLMQLPRELPTDIDYNWYVHRANDMLYECGRFKKAPERELF